MTDTAVQADSAPAPRAPGLSPGTSWLLFSAAALFSATAILWIAGDITFLSTDWALLLERRGLDAAVLLDPVNDHIAVAPVIIYKLLLELFGMDSARPFQAAAIATFLASAGLLFAWLRGRVGGWIALGATVLLLFCGAAWEDLLWAFQIGYFGSMAAGLGMLLALRREDRAGDRIACVLLVVSLAFSGLGIPWAVGAAVAVGTGPAWRRRVWVVAIPVALYALWWAGWGHTADTHVSLANVAASPKYVFDSIASGISSLLGLATPRDEAPVGALDWGRPLAALALVLGGVGLYRLRSVPRWLWVVGTVALSYWLLAAINHEPGHDATSSRYQYVGAILLLLIAAELVRGVRFGLGALAIGAAVVALAVLSNLNFLHQAADDHDRTSDLIRADLGAVEIARDTVAPGFVLTNPIAGTSDVEVSAGSYLSAVDDFGSPADTSAEIAAEPESAREAADRVLASALGLHVVPRTAEAVGDCRTVELATTVSPMSFGPGKLTVTGEPATRATMRLRRFAADSFPVGAGKVTDGTVGISLPVDRSQVLWQLQVVGHGRVQVCFEPAPSIGG